MGILEKQKLVVAVTGASGSIYAKRLFFHLGKVSNLEIAVVFSGNAQIVWEHELSETPVVPFKQWNKNDFNAPFASGSANFQSMVIIPCSMGTLGRIAAGISDELISRAADVILKERRRLICVVRDTPVNLIHLKNMVSVTEAGGIICPASPSFYSKPKDFEALAATVIDRVVDLAGMDQNTFRWSE